MPTPAIQRRWKNLPGEPVGDAGDPYTGYDRFGRTEQMCWIKPHSGDSGFDTLVNVQWGYNRASQKTWRKDLLAPASTGQDQHFGYDGLYQVTERQRGLLNVNTTAVGGVPAQVENFSYDETGNWITYRQVNDGVLGIDETRVNNRSNQMTQVDGSSAGVSYDKNGNMLTVPTGDGLTGSSRKLEWDAWNRLMKVSDADGNVLAEYEYDGLSRRTKVKAGGVTRHFYYDDQWRVVEERLDDATTPERQYVWHPTDRWELLFRDRSTANNGTLDERLYSLKDQLDPVAICDTSGSVVERYDYTAFGISTILNADFTPKEPNTSAFDWNFLFHAEFADAETGWFNYGYRYYVPALGRWLSRDPIGETGGLNLFFFTSNRPFSQNDNLGLITIGQKITIEWLQRNNPGNLPAFTNRFLPNQKVYVDEENEMQNNQDIKEFWDAFYAEIAQLNVDLIGSDWTTIQIPHQNANTGRGPAHWSSNGSQSSGWWLGETMTFEAQGTIQVKQKVLKNGCVLTVRNRNVSWVWKDIVDANTYSELRTKKGARAEGAFLEGIIVYPYMKFVGSDFNVSIFGKDNRALEISEFQ